MNGEMESRWEDPDDLLFQGLDPVLLSWSLQGTHPVLKQVTGEQLPGDTSEEVLEDEERVPFGLSVLGNELVSLSPLGLFHLREPMLILPQALPLPSCIWLV